MKKTVITKLASAVLIAFLTGCSAGRVPGPEETSRYENDTADRTEADTAVPEGGEFCVIRSGKETRDSLSRAVRLRDMAVGEAVGVSVKYVDAADDAAAQIAAAADYLSGTHGFDAAEGSFSYLCAPLLAKGALCAAEEFGDALGETSLNPSLRTGRGTFFITGPIVPGSLSDVSCVAVNLETAGRFSVAIPDEKTVEGKDGFDALTASAAPIPEGTGIYRYGTTDRSVGAAFLVSSGIPLSSGGEEGIPSVARIDGKAADILGKASSVLGDGAVTFLPEDAMPRQERAAAVRSAFSDPGILYLFCKTGDLPTLRDAGNDVRVLPYPGGGNYADSTFGTAWVILRGGGASSAVLSSLEETSLRYTMPEALDAFLSGRTRYDTDSRDAVISILSSPRYEIALALAGEEGEEPVEKLTEAATGAADALIGWDLKAALLSPLIEKTLGKTP